MGTKMFDPVLIGYRRKEEIVKVMKAEKARAENEARAREAEERKDEVETQEKREIEVARWALRVSPTSNSVRYVLIIF